MADIFDQIDALAAPHLGAARPAPALPVVNGDGEFAEGLRSGALGAGSQLNALAGAVGNSVGATDFAQGRYAAADDLGQRAGAAGPRVGSYKDVHGLRDAADYVAGLTGQMLPAAGATTAATLLTGGGAVPAALAATGVMAPLEAGDLVQRQRAAGQDVTLGKDVLGGLGSAAAQSIVPGLARARLGGTIGRMAGGAGAVIPENALTSAAGEAIKQGTLGNGYDTGAMVEAGAAGAAGGVPFAGMHALGNLRGAGKAAKPGVGGTAEPTSAAGGAPTEPLAPTGDARKFNGLTDGYTRAVDAATEKMAAGLPIKDVPSGLDELKAMMPELDKQHVEHARKLGEELLNKAGLTPERRQQVSDFMGKLTDTDPQEALAGLASMAKESKPGEHARAEAEGLLKSVKDWVGERVEGTGEAKKSEDYSGLRQTIDDVISPVLQERRPEALSDPQTMQHLGEALRTTMLALQKGKSVPDDVHHALRGYFGDETPTVLGELHSRVADAADKDGGERLYAALNKMADADTSKRGRIDTLRKNLLHPDKGGPDYTAREIEQIDRTMQGWAGGEYTKGMTPERTRFTERQFRQAMEKDFGPNVDKVLKAYEKRQEVLTPEERDDVVADTQFGVDALNDSVADAQVVRRRDKTPYAVPSPELHAKGERAQYEGKAAELIRRAEEKDPSIKAGFINEKQYRERFGQDPGVEVPEGHGFVVAERMKASEKFTPEEITGLRWSDRAGDRRSNDRVLRTEGDKKDGDIFDAVALTKHMRGELVGEHATELTKPQADAKAFMTGVARMQEHLGRRFDVPDKTVINEQGMTYGEASKLSQRTEKPGARDYDTELKQIREDYKELKKEPGGGDPREFARLKREAAKVMDARDREIAGYDGQRTTTDAERFLEDTGRYAADPALSNVHLAGETLSEHDMRATKNLDGSKKGAISTKPTAESMKANLDSRIARMEDQSKSRAAQNIAKETRALFSRYDELAPAHKAELFALAAMKASDAGEALAELKAKVAATDTRNAKKLANLDQRVADGTAKKSGGVYFINETDSPKMAGSSGAAAWVNMARVREDFAAGMKYPFDNEQKRVVMAQARITPSMLRERITSVKEYAQFIRDHELSHLRDRDSDFYPRTADGKPDLMNKDAIKIEAKATLQAWHKISPPEVQKVRNPSAEAKAPEVPQRTARVDDAAARRAERVDEIAGKEDYSSLTTTAKTKAFLEAARQRFTELKRIEDASFRSDDAPELTKAQGRALSTLERLFDDPHSDLGAFYRETSDWASLPRAVKETLEDHAESLKGAQPAREVPAKGPKSEVAAKQAALVERARSGDKELLKTLASSDDVKGLQRAAEHLSQQERHPGVDKTLDTINERLGALMHDPDNAYGAQLENKHSLEGVGTEGTGWDPAPVREYIDRVLGPKVKTVAANILHAGEFERLKTHDLIRISVHALNPMSTAFHESLHGFFAQLRDLGNTKVIGVLEKAANSPAVINQLRSIFSTETEVLRQLRDPEERAAYMYQAWADGKLKIGPQADGVLGKVAKFFRDMLGIWSNDERALHIMESFQAGDFAKSPSAFARAMTETNRAKSFEAFQSMAEPLTRLGSEIAVAGGQRMRDTGIPALSNLADLMKPRNTEGTGDPGFINAARVERTTRLNAFADALGSYSREHLSEALEHLQAGTKAETPEARLVQGVVKKTLRGMADYMRTGVVVDIGDLGPDYFPRVYDTEYISRHQDEFVTLLESHGVKTDAARETMMKIINADGNEFQIETLRPGMQAAKTRVLTNVPDVVLEPFMQKDLHAIMSTYITQATRRVEWARRFGDDSKGVEEILKQAEKQGATAEDLVAATQFVKGVNGTLGDDINPTARRLMGNMIVYQNLRLLPLAIFSSVIDPMGIIVRGGTVGDAWKTFGRGMKEVTKNFQSMPERDGMTELAESIGTVESSMLVHALGSNYSQGMVGNTAKRINDAFFKYNLMEQFNTSMRVGATEAAMKFIQRHAEGADPVHSARWMAELDLTKGDVKSTPDGRLAVSGADGLSPQQALKVRLAVNKWVDGAVLRPDAVDKPVWMNDPHFALISHLKQFCFSFHETILKRVVHEAQHGNYTGAVALAGYVPVMIAADMIKGLIQGGGSQPSWKDKWGPEDYVWSGVQRGGLLGTGQFLADGLGGRVGSLTGPSLEQLGDAVGLLGGHEQFAPFALKSLPANALYSGLVKGGGGPDPTFAE